MKNSFQHGGTIFAVARQLGIEPEELLDFSASINPLGPSPRVREAVMNSFDRIVHYPDSLCTELKGALAEYHGVSPEVVAVANGSTELIHLVPRLFPHREQRALLLAPTFSEYAHGLELAGWSCDYLILSPESGFSLDRARLDSLLAQGIDLLYLCNPGNPTGRLYPREEIVAVIELCRKRGTVLVLDEAFMDFCEEESARELPLAHENCLILRSMTKFFGFPGLRLGYAIGDRAIVAGIERHRPPWSVGVLAQAAGLAALADRDYVERTRWLVREERDLLATGLGQIVPLKVYPGAANYLLVEIIGDPTVTELQRILLEQRILIRDCSNFVGLGERFFRVAVRSRGENERLRNVIAGAFGQ